MADYETTAMDAWRRKTAIAGSILVIHAAVLGSILRAERDAVASDTEDVSDRAFTTAEIIQAQDYWDKVPAPDLQLLTPAIQITGLQAIRFDDSIEDELAGVIAPASAPRLARVQSVDPEPFARRAHLAPGQAVSVVLRVQVMEDGSVGAADVIRTSNSPEADAAAVDYALALRWIPATKDRIPIRATVSFPVTLAIPAAASSMHPITRPDCMQQPLSASVRDVTKVECARQEAL